MPETTDHQPPRLLPAPATDARWIGALCLLHVVRWLGTQALGMRFDASLLGIYWQYLDPRLLREELIASLLWLHSQPPLFNLFLGLGMQAAPENYSGLSSGLWLLAGVALICLSYLLMRWLATPSWLAGTLCILASVRPSQILFERWPTYDLWVALLVLMVVAGAQLALVQRRSFGMLLLVLSLLLLCGIRSLFHPILIALAALWLVCDPAMPGRRHLRVTLTLAAVLLVTACGTRNVVLFGNASPSSWFGMSVARVATASIAEEELEELRAKGALRLGSTPPFSPLGEYPAHYWSDLEACRGSSPPAAACQQRRSTGANNYNHLAYLEISRDHLHDAVHLLRQHPTSFAESLAKSWYSYFRPPSTLENLQENRDRLGLWAWFWEKVVYSDVDLGIEYRGEARTLPIASVVVLPFLWLWGLHRAWRLRSADPRRARVLLLVGFLISWVAVVGNTFEVWENQRFRYYTDACYLLLFSLWIRQRLLALKGAGRSSWWTREIE